MAKKEELTEQGAVSMVPMHPVETLAEAAGAPGWETAALRAAMGWAPGKAVDQKEFDQKLAALRKRPMGGTL